jgi:molecular chaperone DnaK
VVALESVVESLKAAMGSDNTQEIKRLTEELTQASHKLAEAMYARASAGAQAGAGQAGGSPGGKPKDDDVVDADFEELKK